MRKPRKVENRGGAGLKQRYENNKNFFRRQGLTYPVIERGSDYRRIAGSRGPKRPHPLNGERGGGSVLRGKKHGSFRF